MTTPVDPGEQPALHQRVWDLLRQMRGHLADENLISDAEYVWLAIDAPNMTDRKGGSPAPRRLESYDETRARAEKAEADLAEAQQTNREWLAANGPGGWIDDLRKKLASPPAPSGWQPIESAPPDVPLLLFCPDRGVTNEARVELREARNTRAGTAHAWATHWMPLPSGLGQNAKDALPPSSSDWQPIVERLRAAWTFADQNDDGMHLFVEVRLILDALPPVSEASPAKPASRELKLREVFERCREHLKRRHGCDNFEAFDVLTLTWPADHDFETVGEADASPAKAPDTCDDLCMIPVDPINAAVDAQLADVGDQVKAFGHKLAKETR